MKWSDGVARSTFYQHLCFCGAPLARAVSGRKFCFCFLDLLARILTFAIRVCSRPLYRVASCSAGSAGLCVESPIIYQYLSPFPGVFSGLFAAFSGSRSCTWLRLCGVMLVACRLLALLGPLGASPGAASSIDPSVHPSLHPCIPVCIYRASQLSIHPCIHPCIHRSIDSSIHPCGILRSRCAMHMWCPEHIGRDSWDWEVAWGESLTSSPAVG